MSYEFAAKSYSCLLPCYSSSYGVEADYKGLFNNWKKRIQQLTRAKNSLCKRNLHVIFSSKRQRDIPSEGMASG